MRRAAALLILLATASPALADPAAGTYRSDGRHSSLGAFTGDLTLAPAAGGGWELRGSYRFTASGRRLTWTGRGTVNGAKLDVSVTYATPGLSGAIAGTLTRRARGSYEVGPDGKLARGAWRANLWPRHRVTETLTFGSPIVVDTAVVDLQARPDGKPLAEDAEETTGAVVASNLDDDDGDGGHGGDGQVVIERDFEDADATPGEDDLVEVRVSAPVGGPSGTTLRFSHGAALAIYRGKDRSGRVSSGAALPATAGTFYVEGRAATVPGRGERLVLEAVSNGQVIGSDAVTFHVARSAFLLVGHGCTGTWYVNSQCRERKLDGRTDPTLIKGKTADGTPAYWAVYVGETEKQAKVALSTPDAVISYDGHSNFGMGFAFDTGFSKLSEFMNIADPQIPVNWVYLREHQEHPTLLFDEAEYGDDAATSTKHDPVAVTVAVDISSGPLRKTRWPLSGGDGTRFPLTKGSKRWLDNHYGGEGEEGRLVVKAGSRDMPAKRWAKLFLNSCYSGSYYVDSFGGVGTLFLTTDESSAAQTSGLFMFGFIDGKSNDEVLAELNAVQDLNAYRDFSSPHP